MGGKKAGASRICLLLIGLLGAPGVAVGDFPPITAADRALTEVPGQPTAKGVILYRKADLHFRDYGKDANSRLEIVSRLKILREEGKSLGELEIPHSAELRLDDVEGRVTLPDGRQLDLPKDAIFRERRSRSRKAFATKVVFPQVEVGAIFDWKYTLYWDSFYYLEPWYFHDTLPVRHSEITYHVPPSLGVQAWGRETSGAPIKTRKEQGRLGTRITAWMDDLPALPEEPFAHPNAVLASRYLMIPLRLSGAGGASYPLLESWQEVGRVFVDEVYRDFAAGARETRRQALALAKAAGEDREKRLRALYGFVRDEVRTLSGVGGTGMVAKGLDQVLETRAGTSAEKALLLQVMLQEMGVTSRLLWVADRTQGRPEPEVPNPAAFDATLVVVDEGGERLFLDPGDRSLAFGHLPPFYEATPALLLDHKKSELLTLPARPADRSSQRAELQLTVGADGKVAGRGTLRHEGHYAWRYLRWHEKADETLEAWRERLATVLPDFDLADLEIAEDLEKQEVTLSFRLEQRPEYLLGDEVALWPSRPFTARQPFSLPAKRRLTPVLLAYAGYDAVSLELTWPEGWRVQVMPRATEVQSELGEYRLQVEQDGAARKLRYERRLTRARHEIEVARYGELRELYEQAAAGDAQSLVLVRD